jgi:hypothetical protein
MLSYYRKRQKLIHYHIAALHQDLDLRVGWLVFKGYDPMVKRELNSPYDVAVEIDNKKLGREIPMSAWEDLVKDIEYTGKYSVAFEEIYRSKRHKG